MIDIRTFFIKNTVVVPVPLEFDNCAVRIVRAVVEEMHRLTNGLGIRVGACRGNWRLTLRNELRHCQSVYLICGQIEPVGCDRIHLILDRNEAFVFTLSSRQSVFYSQRIACVTDAVLKPGCCSGTLK